ncbi:serine/threonine-protein kinase DCLK3 [Echinops telfairi]|uniref:non-specific serine/threonine protein kinase n=1 Tax=Echinops telfairi TaxID=9371 RepID=A0ABM0INQ0_ECHTE|nr:serine/threonine-protein kinase DCLK3 [Echinops telfairi]
MQTFEQLLADISEALGFPRWKNDRVRKIFNLKGREIKSISDFFRDGDAFIAMGKEPLTLKNIQLAIEELYPNKARALTLAPRSRAPSPRLKSRLFSKTLKGGHPSGETETTKSGAQAAGSKVTNGPPAREDRARAQKPWGKGKGEAESHSKPSRETTTQEETHESGEKHLGLEIEKTSGEIVRCEKCKRERELQLSRQPLERLSQGTSELALGRPTGHNVEKLVRTRSCRKSPEANPPGGEEEWKGDSHRSSPRNPMHDPRKPGKTVEKREEREPESQESFPPGAVKTKKELAEAQPAPEPGLKEAKKEPRGRHRQGGWLQREHQAEDREEEPSKERKACAPAGRKVVLGDKEPSQVDPEPKTRPENSKPERPAGRKARPAGILTTEVEKHYEPGRVIGDGNFAVVKECRHRESRQAYAMKIIDKSKLQGREDMVDSEIAIMQSLAHPNIVKLHEVYETDTEIYLTMEYVPGGDLFDAIIESVKFPEREAALMITDVCRALVHLHAKGIVHRDLKPENLLVQRNEDKSTTLKLADFGLAKLVVRPIFTVCGTPTYVAPEILSEKGYGLEVDMWAAGVILYILLCGFPPFRSPERDQDELFSIIQRGHFEFLPPYWDNISEAAKDLVSHLLVVDPHRRYTAHQVLQHPWIEAAGKPSPAHTQKEASHSTEGPLRSQHKRSAEEAAVASPPRTSVH